MRKSLMDIEHMVVKDKVYPGLSEALKPYYAYLRDCGHSIMVVPKVLVEGKGVSSEDTWKYEVPVPVKFFLARSGVEHEGYIYMDVRYDNVFGVVVDDGYEEF